MSQHRESVGSTNGYLIISAEEFNAEGNQIAFWFEVYGPDGGWLSSFQSNEAAAKFIAFQEKPHHPRLR